MEKPLLGLAAPAVLAGALALAAPAAADPEQPTDQPPAAATSQGMIPPLSAFGSILGQRDAAAAGPLGLPDLSGSGPALLLGQNPVPSAPGTPTQAVVPSLSAFNGDYLLGQNLTPAAPGEGAAAPGMAPDSDSPGTGRIAFLRRLHEMYGAGELKGALLSQNPKDELGQPVLPVEPTPAG